MKKQKFEKILTECCEILTDEARCSGFTSSPQFENRVRQVLDDLTKENHSFTIDFTPHPQAFPDIALGVFGVEVNFQ